MPIEIQQPGLADLYLTAAELSRRKAEARIAQQQLQEQGRIDTLQIQQEHQRQMKLLDSTLDLEMYERSKRWEIDKMEISSRMDFERGEQKRAKKLDDIDNALRQIDKEVESGRITSKQAEALKFSWQLKRYEFEAGISPTPIGLIKPPAEAKPKEISPTQQIAAYKALQGEEFEEPTWWQKKLPEFLGGKEPLTKEDEFYRAEFKRIARGELAAPVEPISQEIPEPITNTEFENIVRQLAVTDRDRASAYYIKWKDKF